VKIGAKVKSDEKVVKTENILEAKPKKSGETITAIAIAKEGFIAQMANESSGSPARAAKANGPITSPARGAPATHRKLTPLLANNCR
jgi:hypothetical protein